MKSLKVIETGFQCGRTCTLFEECRFTEILRHIGRTRVFSHVAKVDVEVKDLEALKLACEKLGLKLNIGQKTYKWYGRSVGDYPLPAGMTEKDLGKCTHAISIPDNSRAYEIGVIEQKDGTFRLVWDFYQGGFGLQPIVGNDCKTLVGEYTIEVAKTAATNKGWVHQENTDGTLTIYHPKGGQINVDKSGKVESSGFTGKGCDVASAIEQALGSNQERANKKEYMQADKAKIRN